MLQIGTTDVFERLYTQKFRAFAGQFGEFVTYERDRAARDIGLHLTKKRRSSQEAVSGALCWFQLKGVTKAKLSETDFSRYASVKISLKVSHLQFWYLQPMPTYLAVYIECADSFLVLNLQQYVESHWGRGIMALKQKELTVEVPRSSLLDAQAFYLILKRSEIQEWVKVLGTDDETARLCRRDCDFIWHIGTELKRKVKHRATIIDWQSKLRGEVHFEESPLIGDEAWQPIRNHWQLMLRATDVEAAYPYLEFFRVDEEEDWSRWDDYDSSVPELELANGDVIRGEDACGEYFEYVTGVTLNRLGKHLFKSVRALEKIGLIEIDENLDEFISIAPWESRSV